VRARLVVLVTALVGALGVPASAQATIVVQKGIAGVQLGMTRSRVLARLGQPPKRRSGTNDFGQWTGFVYPRVTVTFQSGARVTSLRTTSLRERTARGVGPGSTEAQVRARVAGVRCRSEFGFRHCFLGRFLPGRVVTDFHIRRGRVSIVVIGYVLD
jgi:hypothetical protein